MSDLLLGFPSFTSPGRSPTTRSRLRTTAFNAYAQDDWQVGRDVTLNLGPALRVQHAARRPDQPHVGVRPRHRHGRPRGHRTACRTRASAPTATTSRRGSGVAWRAASRHGRRAGGYGLYYDSGMFEVNSAHVLQPAAVHAAAPASRRSPRC
ncbi:MAG: hypothetical protein MZW92_53350 [Comamonadaceae bacterium]|nr:hypothetical protein [Comamonadaceae bacterium]